MEIDQTWADGYELEASVHDFSKDLDLKWPITVMSLADNGHVSITVNHMALTESYPSTFDAVMGNYK